jgi:PAS domain S-box-containing protein
VNSRFLKGSSRRRFTHDATAKLRTRLHDAQELLRAFENGEVDAILRPGPTGEQIYTLKGADHVYRLMVETMSDGAITLSPDGVILYSNRRFAELLSTGLDDVMGHRIQEFADPAAQASLSALLLASNEENMQCAIDLRSSSGAAVPVYLALRRLEVEGSSCSIAVVTDLSQMRRSEAEIRLAAERFHMAIEAAPTGMLLMNLKGSIVMVNAQIELLFGYSREELIGTPLERLVPNYLQMHPFSEHSSSFNALSALIPETAANVDVEGIRKDSTKLPIEIAFTLLHTSQEDLMLASIVDLSARREVDRMRTEFVSMVSHELRTPLTAISASLGLLHSGVLGELADRTAAMVQIAHRNSGRLERIINDILDIGTLEAGKMAMHITTVSLAELLQQSVEASAGYAELCDVRFLLDCDPVTDLVKADPNRLVQVIANLLSNAAKFSPEGADVLIRVLPGPSMVRIEVQDFGPGIPEEFQCRIFEKFAQVQPVAKRRFEGAGLGLSIARKLIEAMSGFIGFTSVVNQGTVFYLELPRADTATTTH